MKLRICHFLPFFQKASGVSTFVGEVAKCQMSSGHDIAIATLQWFMKEHYPIPDSIHVVDVGHATTLEGQKLNVVHIHGIWTPILHRIVKNAVQKGIPLVWSTHGMLASWAMRHKWWKKWPVWWLWQKRDLSKATVIHVTSESEARRVRDLGFRNRLEIVPLGTAWARMPVSEMEREKIVLFVGRIYPIKGLENLIRAWSLVQGDAACTSGWRLRLVGPDQAGYMSKLKELCGTCNVSGSVDFAGPKFDEELLSEYQRASVSVLPSFTENFGGVVIDSLACGCPVIASTGTPWSVLQGDGTSEESRCGWWVGNSPSSLAQALREAMSLDEKAHRQMSAAGCRLVASDYTWPRVGEKLLSIYQSIAK